MKYNTKEGEYYSSFLKHKLKTLNLVDNEIISLKFWKWYNPEFTITIIDYNKDGNYPDTTYILMYHNRFKIVSDYTYMDTVTKKLYKCKNKHNLTITENGSNSSKCV